MENREGIQPESIKPTAGGPPARLPDNTNGTPAEALREGLPPMPAMHESEASEEEPGFFTPGNFVMLMMMVALAVYLSMKFDPIEILAIGKAVLGLSFVIFIHELGHFLAAKLCDVNVTTFSIGFGPAIPGCRFTWGETTYKLAILPLGGYVQMVGQVDGDEASDGSDDDPRSYRRKSVPQRMLIISAGVIMNAILAVACFIYVYEGPGKEHPAAVVNSIDSGGPLFAKGARTGAAILQIGDVQNPTFTDLMQTVINTNWGDKIAFQYQLPNKEPALLEIEPRMDRNTDKKPVIGLTSPPRLQLLPLRQAPQGPFEHGTPAAAAGFKNDDVIIAMTDPDHPDKIKDLPEDPRPGAPNQRDYFEFVRRLDLLADKKIVIRVRRITGETTNEVDLTLEPMPRLSLGAIMQMGPILALREKSDAAQGDKVRGPSAEKKLRGDVIERVSVKEVDGSENEFFQAKILDPARLPHELRQWSDRLDRAGFKGERIVTLHLSRQREGAGLDQEKVKVDLRWDKDWRFDRVAPWNPNSPLAIPELGLAYQVRSVVVDVPNKASLLKVGDVIKNINMTVEGDKKDIELKWMKKEIEEGQWAYMSRMFSITHTVKKLVLKVERDKKVEELEIPLQFDASWCLPERGWILTSDVRRVKADNAWNAIRFGFNDTGSRMKEVFLNLRGMIVGRIDVDNVGGPLMIAHVTYRFAGMDFGDLVFFLGLISINLAVVNFLPIPVLDGGHMVFLIYEGIRKKPAPEAVRIFATYVGLAMIACLMIFVFYQDIKRFFFSD